MASPYRKRYFDQAQIESDHKDVIISQLKAECFELRENERDYNDLNSRVNNLNHRFNLLQEEKVLDEKEHNYRSEVNLKTINALRDEVVALKGDLTAVERDNQDLRADNESVNLVIRAKTADLAQLKSDLADLSDDNSQLNLQNKELDRQVIKVQSENKEQVAESHHLSDKVDEANTRQAKNERLIAENEKDVQKLLRIQDDLKAQQEDLRANIREKTNVTRNAEHELSENKKRIISLEARLNDRRRVNDKLKNDIGSSQRDQDEEIEKGTKIMTRIRGLEADIEDREDEITTLRRQVAELRKEQTHLLETNDALINDIKVSNRHLDVVTVQNYNLIDEVEKINQEDEEIRDILNRRERVHETTSKCTDRMRVSTVKLNSTLQSPVKTASTKDGFEV